MKLSIVIPCYNEGEKLSNNLYKLHQYMKTLPVSYEVIVVDDGSTDQTKQRIESVLPSMEATTLLHYMPNHGKGYAVKTGFLASKGDIVLFTDSDLSIDLSAISDAIAIFKEDSSCVGVIASRTVEGTQVEKTFIRQVFSVGCHLLTRFLTGMAIRDTQCGFKAFRIDVAQEMARKQRVERFAFDAEYLYIAHLNHWNIREIPVIIHDDKDSKVRIVRDTVRFFFDLLKIRANRKYYLTASSE